MDTVADVLINGLAVLVVLNDNSSLFPISEWQKLICICGVSFISVCVTLLHSF
jgi:hypothetical protein